MSLVFSDRYKIFGAGVDAADDPWTLQLKQAAMHALENGADDLSLDPYTVLAPMLTADNPSLIPVGIVGIPEWLRPIPSPRAREMVTQAHMTRFVASGGMLQLAMRVRDYVRDTILPDRPLMLGVDHAMSGGVITALADQIGAAKLSIIILDQHFDALPLSLRIDTALPPIGTHSAGQTAADEDAYCCGNFLMHLIDSGAVLPENLLLIGVADYPGDHTPAGGEKFRDSYLALERRGCRFFPAARFAGDFQQNLAKFIADQITTPNIYVSLDMDVGAHRCVHAARYMDTTGISLAALRHTAQAIASGCRQGLFRLVGMDVMEFNMHFLGLEYEVGKQDATLSVALDFIKEIIAVPGENMDRMADGQ